MKKSVAIIVGLLIVVGGLGYYFMSGGDGENFQGLMRRGAVEKKSALAVTTPAAPVQTAAIVKMFPLDMPIDVGIMKMYQFNFMTSDFPNTYLTVVPNGTVQSVKDGGPQCQLTYEEAYVNNLGVKCKVPAGQSTFSFKVQGQGSQQSLYRAFMTIVDSTGKEVAISEHYNVP